jgi:hypothetical protein
MLMELYVQAKLRELGDARLARRAPLPRPEAAMRQAASRRPLLRWARAA